MKMPRPCKGDKPKSEVLQIRLTPEEKEKLMLKAKDRKMDMATYIRFSTGLLTLKEISQSIKR